MLWAILLLLGIGVTAAVAQDRLKSMPGHAQYGKMSREIPRSYKSGALGVTWKDGGKVFEYAKDGKTHRFDIAAQKSEAVGEAAAGAPRPGFGPGKRAGG